MRLSSRVDYALSCILRVADSYGKCPVSVKDISKKERLADNYVEQLLVRLKRYGSLKSFRGKRGGYVLALSPRRISVMDVMKAIDGEVLRPVCFRKKGRRKKCIHLDNCKIRIMWQGLKEEIEFFLKRCTLDKLLKLRKKEKGWL